MKDIEELKNLANEWPANQWFCLRDIDGGNHSPMLWKYLCESDHYGRTREDGARLVSRNTCLEFMWKK